MSKVWVDDERPAPDGFVWAINSQVGIGDVKMYHALGTLEEVSLDHDLGGEDTGMKVLEYMIAFDLWPKTLTIHTANPPARENMLRAANAEAPDWVDIQVIHW